jgi:hypothetical protein
MIGWEDHCPPHQRLVQSQQGSDHQFSQFCLHLSLWLLIMALIPRFGNRTKDHTGDLAPRAAFKELACTPLHLSGPGFPYCHYTALLDFIDIDEQHLRYEAALSAILDERDLMCRKILHPSFDICCRHDGARDELATSAEPWALGGSFHIKRGSRLPPTYGYR